VLALEVVWPTLGVTRAGNREQLGPDLRGVFRRFRRHRGDATKITVRCCGTPETVRTLLADFGSIEAAGEVVATSWPPGSCRPPWR